MTSKNILSQNTTSKRKAKKHNTQSKNKKTKRHISNCYSNHLVTFILLCDMPGYRMKSYGSTSMADILGKKLIDLQIQAIKECFKKYEIVICSGFDCENLYKYIRLNYKRENIRIVENQLFNNCNSCESLRLCLNNINNNKIFVLDGSLFFSKNIFNKLDLNKSFLMTEKFESDNLEIGLNIDEDGNVEHISFGASSVWSEIFYLCEQRIVDLIKKMLSNNMDYKNKFIFELLNDAIDLKYKFSFIQNTDKIIKINNLKTYRNTMRKK